MARLILRMTSIAGLRRCCRTKPVMLAAKDNRLFVAVLWVARTGCPWRDLPEVFGPWNSMYKRFSRWSNRGVWHRLFAELAKDADFEQVFLDSTMVRAHQHAAGAPKKTATKRSGARAGD